MEHEHKFALFGDSDQPDGMETATEVAATKPVGRIRTAVAALSGIQVEQMSRSEAQAALQWLSQGQAVMTSLMCDIGRHLADSEPDVDPAEVLRRNGRLPGRESKKLAKMAKQLSDMPKVREKFSRGDITTSHAKALANAAEKVGPETVDADQDLLDAADDMPPDRFDRMARRWSEEKLIEGGVNPLRRQQRARQGSLWVDRDSGLGMVMAKVPRPQFELLRQAVDGHYLRLLRQDGSDGRDADSVRTARQRLADVLVELLTGRDALTGQFIDGDVVMKAKAATQLILTAPLDVVDGTERDGQVEIIGVGPVPPEYLRTLTSDTELAAMLFDRKGRPLWLGRNQRLGNAAQRLAVAVRDGGCFECGAPIHRCELHHMQEWHRDRGRTDVDNLIAVCRRHHKWLETNNLIVRRTPTGYETRPRAGPDPPE